MFKSLRIHNFQSHKQSTLLFSPGVNVILGQSDSGKTATLRALRWVLENKPGGDAFRSTWGGDTRVTLTTMDGHMVQRGKGATGNTYKLNGELLKAFGQGVPEEVQVAMNLNGVNVQQQLEAPYLLSETSGEVAKHFNRVANIDMIDQSVSRAKSLASKTRQSIAQRTEDLKEKQEQYKRYETLNTVDRSLRKLENKEKQSTVKQGERKQLIQVTGRIREIDGLLKTGHNLLVLEPRVLALGEKVQVKKQKQMHLFKLHDQITAVKTTLGTLQENKEFLESEPLVKTLVSKQSQKKANTARLSTLSRLIGQYATNSKKVAYLYEKQAELSKQLPKTCPICNGPLKQQEHEHN